MPVSEADIRRVRQDRASRRFLSEPLGVPLTTKPDLHGFAAKHVGLDAAATYLEFGVASGVSLARFAGLFTNPNARLFGFDSFRGLPADWFVGNSGVLPKGTFDQGGNAPPTADRRISYIKGWFQNTVPEFLEANRLAAPVLVHFDADLYESTFFLLASLWPRVPSYSFVMDDFTEDDMVALYDFLAVFPCRLRWLAHHRNDHGHPVQIFGHIERAPMVIE